MGMGGGSNDAASEQKAQQAAEQAQIAAGKGAIDKTFDAQFTPGYYDTYAKTYADYATPQLDSQYSKAKAKLSLALANQGIANSTAANEEMSDLDEQYTSGKQGILNQGLSYANDLKGKVNSARGNLYTQLNNSAMAGDAAQSATDSAFSLTGLPNYQPLGNLFGNVSALTENQSNLQQMAAFGYAKPRVSLSSGGATANSTQVT